MPGSRSTDGPITNTGNATPPSSRWYSSGTPGQVAPLIPSGENGLFSREVFYYKSQIREWIDQFSVDEVDAEKEFHRMGYEWKATIDQLKCRGTITLRLDERQQAAFNDSFVRLFLRARQSNGQEMNSSVVRLAINLVRFMEVVAMLRALEQPGITAAGPRYQQRQPKGQDHRRLGTPYHRR